LRAALIVVMGLTVVGLHPYLAYAAAYGGTAWDAFLYAVAPVGVFAPILALVSVGDSLASDAASGYLALLLLRVPLFTVLWIRGVVAIVVWAMVMAIAVLPACVFALVSYPTGASGFVLPGVLPQVYHGAPWVITVANFGTMALGASVWAVASQIFVSSWTRNPYWTVAVPLAVYLGGSLVLPAVANPIQRIALFAYVPAIGPLWTDPVVWVAVLVVFGVAGSARWMLRGEWVD